MTGTAVGPVGTRLVVVVVLEVELLNPGVVLDEMLLNAGVVVVVRDDTLVVVVTTGLVVGTIVVVVLVVVLVTEDDEFDTRDVSLYIDNLTPAPQNVVRSPGHNMLQSPWSNARMLPSRGVVPQ
jgi:hypothetical protein